jgi:uncharacterized SAM-binding protein YcdF (DUF218 family)
MMQVDCIFVPGGGLLPGGILPPWTVARLDYALSQKERTRWIACLSGGTVHKPPPLNKDGFSIFESHAAGNYLVSKGTHPQQILTEISSYDTIGNAYFSRLLFSDPLQFDRLLVITSEFHMQRTRAAFEWIYGLTPLPVEYKLRFETVPDKGLSPQVLKTRTAREKKSLEKMRKMQMHITTLDAFHSWLYSEHSAYSVSPRPGSLTGDVLESY